MAVTEKPKRRIRMKAAPRCPVHDVLMHQTTTHRTVRYFRCPVDSIDGVRCPETAKQSRLSADVEP